LHFPLRRLTSRLRRLPDFVVIGAMKCGTSMLFSSIARHPSVVPALRKEVHYFDYARNFRRGEGWYRAHFPLAREWSPRASFGRSRPILTGEASPYYSFHPLSGSRLRATAPNAKLILVIRDPVARAWSHHRHETRLGYEDLPFEAAIDAEEERLSGEAERFPSDPFYYGYAHQYWSYAARGRYAEQIRAWTSEFPRDQMLVLELERLVGDWGRSFEAVFDFLGLARFVPERPRPRRSEDGPALAAGVRERLRRHFEPYDQELSLLLGRAPAWH
jgi:hypothetical protein